jgi:hypothetical protein
MPLFLVLALSLQALAAPADAVPLNCLEQAAPSLGACEAPQEREDSASGARLLSCSGVPRAFALPHARASARGRALRASLRGVTALAGGALDREDAEQRVLAGASCSTADTSWFLLGTRLRDPRDVVGGRVRIPHAGIRSEGAVDGSATSEVLREHLDALEVCAAGSAAGELTLQVRTAPDGAPLEIRALQTTVTPQQAACLEAAVGGVRFASAGTTRFVVELGSSVAER